MFEKLRALVTRYPDKENVAKELQRANSTFQDMIDDHHNVTNRIDSDDTDAWERHQLRRRRLDMEEKMLLMMSSNLRV